MSAARAARAAPVVTLVHGTFGRLPGVDAAWTRTSAPVQRTLRSRLGDDTLFTSFRWSGMNWPSARYRAARRLETHLREAASRHPERSLYVVAHSHGGNVALHALRAIERDTAAPPVAGVVCLSTPFIVAQPRALTTFRFVSTYAVLLAVLFAFVANAMGALLEPLLARVDPADELMRALVLNEVWLEFVLCAVLAWYATRALVGLARHRYSKIALPAPRTPIHIVRGVGDEASALLATSSFFSWLVTLVWNFASTLTTGVALAFAAMLSAPLLLPAGLALLVENRLGKARLRHGFRRALRSRTVGATIIAFGAFGAFASWGYFLAGTAYGTAEQWYGVAVATLVLAIVSFSALSGLGYGLTAPFLEVTAEATPPGSWETHLFEAGAWTSADGTHASRPAFLSHSAAYADETVLDSIACWMAAQGEGRSAARADGSSGSTQRAAGRSR